MVKDILRETQQFTNQRINLMTTRLSKALGKLIPDNVMSAASDIRILSNRAKDARVEAIALSKSGKLTLGEVKGFPEFNALVEALDQLELSVTWIVHEDPREKSPRLITDIQIETVQNSAKNFLAVAKSYLNFFASDLNPQNK